MDEEVLQAATEDWVAAGMIDEETAESIRIYETNHPRSESPERRIARVVAVMGAILIGAGIITFLAGQWEDLSVPTRTGILVLTPVIAAAAGVKLADRSLPRAGHALWVLGAALTGPAVFLLAEMHAPGLSDYVLLLVWGLVALPMGHAFASRPGTALGLGVLLLSAGIAGEADTGFFLAALLGGVAIAASVPLRTKTASLVDTYRVVGVVPMILTLLWLNTREGDFQFVSIVWDSLLGTVFLLSIVSVGAVLLWYREGTARRGDLLAVGIPIVGAICGIGLIGTEGILPAFGAFLLGHLVLLVLLLGLVVVGITTGSRVLINLVVLGFLLQVLTLLQTMTDQLPGTIALVLAGIVLIVAAIGLERGRRRVLGQIPREE